MREGRTSTSGAAPAREAYGPDPATQFHRAAIYVDRIVKGADPAELPIEQLTWFELIVDVKIAQALGLILPVSLVAPANEVLE